MAEQPWRGRVKNYLSGWRKPVPRLVIVNASGSFGFYLFGRLIHRISSSERPYNQSTIAAIVALMTRLNIPVDHVVAINTGDVLLPDALESLRLADADTGREIVSGATTRQS